MKFALKSISLLAFAFLTSVAFAQTDAKYETVTLNVPGVCDMCKARIETTVYDVPGVKTAKWDKKTEVLTAVISPKKTSRQKVADALAAKGYRSDLAEADVEAYQKLPGCCQYDSVGKH